MSRAISLVAATMLVLAPQRTFGASGRLNAARDSSHERPTIQSLLRCASQRRQASIRCLDEISASPVIESFDEAVKAVRRVLQTRPAISSNELPSGPPAILYKPLLDMRIFKARSIRGQPFIYDIDIAPNGTIAKIIRKSGATGFATLDEYIDTRARRVIVLPETERGVYRPSKVVLVYHIDVH